MQNFKQLINQANLELQKVSDFLIQNEEALLAVDLKLYDISYNPELQNKHNLTEEGYEKLFDEFCEYSMREYEEWRETSGLTNEHCYIGSTSSFFLESDIIEVNRNIMDIPTTIADFLDKTYSSHMQVILGKDDYYSNIENILDDNGLASLDKLEDFLGSLNKQWLDDTIEILKDHLEYIAEGTFYTSFTNKLQDVVEDYNYIKSFKANQVIYFDDFIAVRLETYPKFRQRYTVKEA
jgi:hypothetical protein